MLTDYQMAILQQMGIPVLEKKLASEEVNSVQDTSTEKAATAVQKLRQSVQTKPAASEPIASSAALDDVILSLKCLELMQSTSSTFFLSPNKAVSITSNEVLIPCSPDTATIGQKRQLWQAMTNLAK